MTRRRKILDALPRGRLLEIAKVLGVAGLAGKTKEAVAAALAGDRSLKTPAIVVALSRDELKAVCRSLGLDDSGQEKQALIDRLIGGDGGGSASTTSRGGASRKDADDFALGTENPAPSASRPGPRRTKKAPAMARSSSKRDIEQYEHSDKTRVNNPPVGLVTPATDPDTGEKRKTYQYDPHLDPQLVWAGKAEHMSFEVPTVSLHVHERIDPRSIVDAVRKRSGDREAGREVQRSLFEEPEENPPLRQAVDFYKHAHGWTNRLVAGDSLLVMNSLLEKEAIRAESTECLRPVFDSEHPIRSTGDMRPWYTGRPNHVTEGSHVSHVVYDSTWEASEAYILDHSDHVAAWVKNDHLGFEIVYVFEGVVHKYRPDFLVRLTNGKMLVLEVKGQNTAKDATKRHFLDEWVKAVNGYGDFGRWLPDVSRAPQDVADILDRVAAVRSAAAR